ncbi:MAG TPA: sugar-binding protein [Bryobacteraceae bacterium]|nr:sugar-binding protein [Bryobacteraceae bacterium]
MSRTWLVFLAAVGCLAQIPKLERPVRIDGDLSEWREYAFHDGVWDLARLRHAPWYDPAINRLTTHGQEPAAGEDLAARYYMAWDERYLYLGADVKDNVNDVSDPKHEPKRWYYKDAICWFIEAPRRAAGQKFGEGDNAFCFVIDTTRPAYAAWWRHGAPGKTYIEEPIPPGAVQYAIRRGQRGDFVLEARVEMAPTLGVSTPHWRTPRAGDSYGVEIVHTDPDGGDYGGHFLIYGRGDDDSTWGSFQLTAPQNPIERKLN